MDKGHKQRILEAQRRAELMTRLTERGFYVVGHQPLPHGGGLVDTVIEPTDADRLTRLTPQ